jgi:hypothetical protein
MTAHDPSKDKAPKAYTVGYRKPPKSGQFKFGQRANPHGRPKGQPSQEQILLEEAARLVKVTIGDQVVHISKERWVLRKLLDLAGLGNMAAARLYFSMRYRAQIAMEAAPEAEEPLTAEELDALKLMGKNAGK